MVLASAVHSSSNRHLAEYCRAMPESERHRRTILVTGFGAFPGAPRNPTEMIVGQLPRHAPRLARLGIKLRCATLAVRYADLPARLAALADEHRPDIILHLGLAARRHRISIETRAINRANPLHSDASRRRPAQMLEPGGPDALRATVPARRICAALRASGIATEISRDAGDYVCNATLYLSIAHGLAAETGFIHVPQARRSSHPKRGARRRLSHAELLQAVLSAVLVLSRPSLA